MAQPASSNSLITRDYLINNFTGMFSVRTLMDRTYTHFIPKPTSEAISDPSPFPIYECNCSNWMQRSWRDTIERKLLRKVAEVFDKTKPLTLYSLGSGNCYQELS